MMKCILYISIIFGVFSQSHAQHFFCEDRNLNSLEQSLSKQIKADYDLQKKHVRSLQKDYLDHGNDFSANRSTRYEKIYDYMSDQFLTFSSQRRPSLTSEERKIFKDYLETPFQKIVDGRLGNLVSVPRVNKKEKLTSRLNEINSLLEGGKPAQEVLREEYKKILTTNYERLQRYAEIEKTKKSDVDLKRSLTLVLKYSLHNALMLDRMAFASHLRKYCKNEMRSDLLKEKAEIEKELTRSGYPVPKSQQSHQSL